MSLLNQHLKAKPRHYCRGFLFYEINLTTLYLIAIFVAAVSALTSFFGNSTNKIPFS